MPRGGRLVLVTGGAGFIGSHLVQAFLEHGESVRVFDNFSTGNMDNLSGFCNGRWKAGRDFDVIVGDVRDAKKLSHAVSGSHVIVHQAASVSVCRSVEDPLKTVEINALGTLNVFLAARYHKVDRVIYASSSSVYGNTDSLPWSEGFEGFPLSPYGLSKKNNEDYARLFRALYGLQAVGFRYFNVYGPRQEPSSEYSAVIPKFVAALLGGDAPVIYGTGMQSRDFVYVGDVARANLLALDASSDAVDRAYNVGTGVRWTLLELAAILSDLVGVEIAPHHAPPRPGDIMHSCADPSLAREMLGFEAHYDLREGLRKSLEWYHHNLAPRVPRSVSGKPR